MSSQLAIGFWTIPKKMLLFLLIIFLPASGIIIVSGLVQRERAMQEAEDRAFLLVRIIAAQQEEIAAGAKQMLSALAQSPQVKKMDRAACNDMFDEVIKRHPFYSTISLATPVGNVLASASSGEPGLRTRSNTGPTSIAVNPCAAPTRASRSTESNSGARYGWT